MRDVCILNVCEGFTISMHQQPISIVIAINKRYIVLS